MLMPSGTPALTIAVAWRAAASAAAPFSFLLWRVANCFAVHGIRLFLGAGRDLSATGGIAAHQHAGKTRRIAARDRCGNEYRLGCGNAVCVGCRSAGGEGRIRTRDLAFQRAEGTG